MPASAALSGTLDLGSASVTPGASTTVTATFVETTPVLGGTVVSVIVTPGSGSTGSVTLSVLTTSGDVGACDIPSLPAPATGTRVDCLWTTGSTSGGVVVTATASAGATGSFSIATSVEGADPDSGSGLIVVRPVASTTLLVAVPPTVPTTTAPTTTVAATTAPATTAPVTTAPTPSSTAAVGSELPTVGGNSAGLGTAAAAVLVAVGAIAVSVSRRSSHDRA